MAYRTHYDPSVLAAKYGCGHDACTALLPPHPMPCASQLSLLNLQPVAVAVSSSLPTTRALTLPPAYPYALRIHARARLFLHSASACLRACLLRLVMPRVAAARSPSRLLASLSRACARALLLTRALSPALLLTRPPRTMLHHSRTALSYPPHLITPPRCALLHILPPRGGRPSTITEQAYDAFIPLHLRRPEGR